MKLRPFAAAALLLTAACGDDASPIADAGLDAGADVADTQADAATDVGLDAQADAQADADNSADGTCERPFALTETDGVWSYQGTTVGAPSEMTASCAEEPGAERVIAWTAPADGPVLANLTGADPLLHVRTDCAAIATEVACNDDATNDTTDSVVTFEAESGVTYYVIADTYDDNESSPFSLTIAPAPDPVLPPGIWRARGYGILLEVTETDFSVYEYSSAHCLRAIQGPLLELGFLIDVIAVEPTLQIQQVGALNETFADAIDALPTLCVEGLDATIGEDGYTFDAEHFFDIVVATFDDYYPFFALREVDWDAAVATARADLSGDTTEAELQDVLVTLLTPLNDGHVGLTTPSLEFEGAPFAAFATLHAEWMAQDEIADEDDYQDREMERYFGAIASRLTNVGGDVLGMYWGTVAGAEHIGYLRTVHFGHDDISVNLDQALTALADVDTLIVDVRVNTGGADTQAIEMASRFATETTEAFTKSPYLAPDSWGPETVVYTPACDAEACFDGPVMLLTSASTVSAAEIFTLAARVLPNVTTAGENTSGELSDILGRLLPNGWEFGLSHERYMAVGGTLYEAVGIPPELAFDGDPLDREDRAEGRDPWLDAAIEALTE